jgi:capsular polysaccharide biosynthesis protein
MNKEESNSIDPVFHDEIDLKDILIPLWRSKYSIVLYGVICLLSFLIYSLGGFTLDKTNNVSLQVHFNFQGAETGQFPNGENFSPQELISGSVLSDVYGNIDRPEFTYPELVKAIQLKAGFHGASELNSVVTQLLSKGKSLTPEAYSEAVLKFTKDVLAESKTNAILTVDLDLFNGNLKRASDLLTNIPKVWAKKSLEERGVLVVLPPAVTRLNTRIMSGNALIQVNVLGDTLILLSDSVNALLSKLSNQSIKDPDSGMSVADLSYKLNVEDKYRVSILRELVLKNGVGVENGFREARLRKLARQESSYKRMIGVYEQVLVEFNQQQQKKPHGEYSVSSQSDARGTVQYGEGSIDSLLNLGSKISDPEYRKELLGKKIDISVKLEKVLSEKEFYDAQQPSNTASVSTDEINRLVIESYSELETIHLALLGIIGVSNMNNVDDKGELFDIVGSVQESMSSNLTEKVGLRAVLAFILGCMIAVVIVLLRRVVR